MVERTDLKKYSDYCWGTDSNSMLAIFKDDKENDVLVYLPDFESETKVLPVSPERGVHCLGISRASDENVFVSSFSAGNDALIFMYNTSADQGRILMNLKNVELSKASFSPGGSQIVVAANSFDKAIPSGIIKIDINTGIPQLVITGNYESPIYSPDGNSILATKVDNKTGKKDVVLVDAFSGSLTNLTTNGKSHDAVFSPVTED